MVGQRIIIQIQSFNMKKLCILLSCCYLILAGCKKAEEEEQAEGRPFTPRIFNETSLFPENPDSIRVMSIGQHLSFTGLQYSPAEKVKVSWKINDEEVSSAESYDFAATTGGEFRIRLDVEYNGTIVSRYRDVFVISDTFKPKTASNVILSYLNDTASYKYADWSTITHLAYKVATVTATGTIDVSKGEPYRKAEALTGRAHMNGVSVLLGVSGALSGDGWSVSQSNNFGAMITDATKRATLVQSIKDYVTAKKMDGVDIMMTDINASAAIINANIAATGALLNELRAAMGSNAIITVTVTTNQYYDRYPDLSAASWLNVHAFEDGLHVGPGKALGQSSGYDYFVAGAELWRTKYPASKLVIGIPAFGLRYNQLDANGNNLSWSSYNYIPYKDILAAVPTASGEEYADISKGVYFNGLPLVTQKATYLKANGYLGAYLWAGDYDVKGPNSLTGAISNVLK